MSHIILDETGNLYVLQQDNPIIKKYSIQGKLLEEIRLEDLPAKCPFPNKKIDKITFNTLSVDREGNLYLSPNYPYGIMKFSRKGKYLNYLPKEKVEIIAGASLFGTDGMLYFLNLVGSEPIVSVDTALLNIKKIPASVQEYYTSKVDFDRDMYGNFYVSIYGNSIWSSIKFLHEVIILDKDGKIIDNFGQFGEEEENFCWGPCGIAVDRYGNIYAGDAYGASAENPRLQIFDNYGRFWEKFPFGGNKIKIAPSGIIITDMGSINRGVIQYPIPKNEIAAFAPSKMFFFSGLTENYESGISAPGRNSFAGKTWMPEISDKTISDYFRAFNYLKQKKVNEADVIFQRLIIAQPDNFHLLSGIARIYRRLKKYDKSAAILGNLLKLYPERYDLYLRLAQVYELQEQYGKSINVYNKSIEKVKTLIAREPEGTNSIFQQWKLRVLKEALFTMKEEKGLYPKKELRLADEKEGWHADAFPEYKLSFSFGGKGSEPGKFNMDSQGGKIIAVDSKDRIIVADSRNQRIQIFSPEGKFNSQIKMNTSAVAVDSKDRIFTVEDEGNLRKVVMLSLDGQLINSSEKVWSSILDLGFRDDSVLVLDTRFQEMDTLDSGLKYLRSFDIYTKQYNDKMVIDKSGNIYLYDYSYEKVKVYDSEGNYLFALPLYPSCEGGVVSNDVICIYGAQNQLYFYNLRNKKLIYKLSAGELYPNSMVLDSKNRLIIADSVNDKIYVFEPQINQEQVKR